MKQSGAFSIEAQALARIRTEFDAGRTTVDETADTIRLRGAGLGLRIGAVAPALTPFSGTYLFRDPRDQAPVFTSYETGHRYRDTAMAKATQWDEFLIELCR